MAVPPPVPVAPGTLSHSLKLKRSNTLSTLLLAVGLLLALGAAGYGYLESQRVEAVVIAVRSVPYGQQITAEDLGTIELPLHRPAQLAGLTDPAAVIGQWAARDIGSNDVMQPSMVRPTPPDQPVYPNGQQLTTDMVPMPFAITTIGPLTYRDRVNIGFSDPSGDPQLCTTASTAANGSADGSDGSTTAASTVASSPVVGAVVRPYACRLLDRVRVLYVDDSKGVAYLELTPYQAHTIWSLQAAGLQLWGERYGATSRPLPALTRLDIAHVTADHLTAPITATARLEPTRGAIPGDTAIPGTNSR